MRKQRISVVLVDHGGVTEVTLFEAWKDARAEFEKIVAEYNEEPNVRMIVSGSKSVRIWAENDDGGSSFPFVECRKQVVEPVTDRA